MIKKLCCLLVIIYLSLLAVAAPASLEPLSPQDAQYLYPVKYISFNGYKVAYIDEGQGQPVIFVHGVSATLASFNNLFPDMIKRSYRIIGIDLLGYGKSDKPDINYSIDLHSQTLLALVKQLHLTNVVLAGHSMGGAVSLSATIREPELVKSLILLTPGGLTSYPVPVKFLFKIFYGIAFGNRFSDLDKARKYYRESVYSWNPAMDDFLKTRERMMIHPEWLKVQKTIRESAISVLDIDKEILPKISGIKIPVLVLLAANDKLVSAKEVKRNIEKRTKKWEIEIFEKCGHLIQYDQQEKTIRSMIDFLKNHD